MEITVTGPIGTSILALFLGAVELTRNVMA
ncbi:hypothetical protein QFZ70_002203 [Arthrobacter sp. V1I9]|nr:hypothetical protein [Arthrobacter sp. V1I9]